MYIVQHKDLSEAREKRDHADQDKLLEFLSSHNPFKDRNESGNDGTLCSIVTGIVADKDVNCYNAESIGKHLMQSIIGQNFHDVKLKRNNKVKSLSRHVVKIRGESVAVNPKQLFNRIVCTSSNSDQLRKCFEYELSTEPHSGFVKGLMRKTKKSALFSVFEKYLAKTESSSKCSTLY